MLVADRIIYIPLRHHDNQLLRRIDLILDDIDRIANLTLEVTQTQLGRRIFGNIQGLARQIQLIPDQAILLPFIRLTLDQHLLIQDNRIREKEFFLIVCRHRDILGDNIHLTIREQVKTGRQTGLQPCLDLNARQARYRLA